MKIEANMSYLMRLQGIFWPNGLFRELELENR